MKTRKAKVKVKSEPKARTDARPTNDIRLWGFLATLEHLRNSADDIFGYGSEQSAPLHAMFTRLTTGIRPSGVMAWQIDSQQSDDDIPF